MNDEARLFGEMRTALAPRDLADALRRAGLDARWRESSLREGGEYVRVAGAGDADCSLERHGAGGYLVHDAGGGFATLDALARALSAALAGLDVAHRLELYANDHAPAAVHHHRWPAHSS